MCKQNNANINIYLNNQILKQVTEIKYLGIFFHNKFRFYIHIEHVTEKGIQLINILSKSARLQWGLGHKALQTIYKGVIVPITTYGAPVWEAALLRQKNIIKIERAHKLINIKMCKAF
jgi:hypothetical protein